MVSPDKINSQFDFNDLDLDKLTKALSENQNTLIKVVLVAGSLIVGWMLFNDHRVKDKGIRTEMTQAKEKLEAIKAHEAAIGDLNSFKSSLPKKINEFELITLISNYAKAYNVTIPSLSPADSKDMGLYDVIDLRFSAMSDNFKDMMLFLRRIEKSDFPLRVDSWSGHEEAGGQISFDIDISAVLIHT